MMLLLVMLQILMKKVAVDSTLAVNILSLDRPALDYALGDLISKKRSYSMEERLKLIKGYLWELKRKNGWLEDRLWNHETAGKIKMEKEGNYYTRAKIAMDMPRKAMLQAGLRGVCSKNYREAQRNLKTSL